MRNIEYEDIRWGKRTPYKAIESERDVCEWYCANTKAIHRLHGALGLLRSVFWPNRFSRFSMYTFYFCAVCVFFLSSTSRDVQRRVSCISAFSEECSHFFSSEYFIANRLFLSHLPWKSERCKKDGIRFSDSTYLLGESQKDEWKEKKRSEFCVCVFFPAAAAATWCKKKANNTSHWYALINYKKNSLCKQTNEQTVAGNW